MGRRTKRYRPCGEKRQSEILNLNDMFIGIDLGGTNIRVATIQEGKILQMQAEPTCAQGAETVVLEQMARLIAAVLTPEVKGIGIGVPSVVDREKGIVYNVVGIPSWT